MKQKTGNAILLLAIGLILSLLNININLAGVKISVTSIAGIILLIIGLVQLFQITKNNKYKTSIILIGIGLGLTIVMPIIVNLLMFQKLTNIYEIVNNMVNSTDVTAGYLSDIVKIMNESNALLLIAGILGMLPMVVQPIVILLIKEPLAELSNNKVLKDKIVKNSKMTFIFNIISIVVSLALTLALIGLLGELSKVIAAAIEGLDSNTVVTIDVISMTPGLLISVIILVTLSIGLGGISITGLVFFIMFIVNVFNLRTEYSENNNINNSNTYNNQNNDNVPRFDPNTGEPINRPRFDPNTGEPLEGPRYDPNTGEPLNK